MKCPLLPASKVAGFFEHMVKLCFTYAGKALLFHAFLLKFPPHPLAETSGFRNTSK
jgi:hypothetical protein